MQRPLPFVFALGLALAFVAPAGFAPYFGRNKLQYEDFPFRVLRTERYDVPFYPEEEEATRDAMRMAERWYGRHAAVFGHAYEKKPLSCATTCRRWSSSARSTSGTACTTCPATSSGSPSSPAPSSAPTPAGTSASR